MSCGARHGSLFVMLLAACTPRVARPPVVDAAVALRFSTQGRLAQELAPDVVREADGIRERAERAAREGRETDAQVFGETAVASLERAILQARAVRATRAHERTGQQRMATERELATVGAAQTQSEAEVQAIELRIRVARDALPLAVAGPADPTREAARRLATQAVATEAHLLCVAAKLAGALALTLTPAEDAVRTARNASEGNAPAAQLDLAMRSRAACLAALTRTRHYQRRANGGDTMDELLTDLGRRENVRPIRDDRGVVVTVHDVFSGASLRPDVIAQLTVLRDIATAHKDVPLLLVVHGSEEPRGTAALTRASDRLADVRRFFAAKENAEILSVGATKPVVDSASNRQRNERVEVVFVDTGR